MPPTRAADHPPQAPATTAVAVPGALVDGVVSHVVGCLPAEGCGLLAVDDGGELQAAYPTTNVDGSPYRFTVAPDEHYAAIEYAESRGWTIAGAFHSHPASEPYPSAADVAGALDPSWLYVIIGLAASAPDVRGYRIRDGVVSAVPLQVTR